MKQPTILYFLPGIMFFCFTFYLLTIPGNNLPKVDWLALIYGDKIIHIGMFAILVVTWCWPFTKTMQPSYTFNHRFFAVAILAFLYGITMEFVQKNWIPNRSFDLGDIAADGLGAFTAFFGCRYFLQPTK